MKYQIYILIIFFPIPFTVWSQPGEWEQDVFQNTYPMIIKKKKYSDTAFVNYEVFSYLQNQGKIKYSTNSIPEVYQQAQTMYLLNFRFDIQLNFSRNLPLTIYICNSREDTMQISMTTKEFYENKGFMDTISFVDGKFNLSEVNEIKSNKEKFLITINNRNFVEESITNDYGVYFPKRGIQFIEGNRIVYFSELRGLPPMFYFGFKRINNGIHWDTLSYKISNDSIFIASSFSTNFLSQQEVWLEQYSDFLPYTYSFELNKKMRKKHEKRMKSENDTLNLTVKTEPLFFKNNLNKELKIYINDSIVFSGGVNVDQKFQFIGNYIKSYSDSVTIKVKYHYSLDGRDKNMAENSFILKGYGTMGFTIGMGYKKYFEKAPFEMLFLRGTRLYYYHPFEIPLLQYGISYDKGFFLIQ